LPCRRFGGSIPIDAFNSYYYLSEQWSDTSLVGKGGWGEFNKGFIIQCPGLSFRP
jgi:hypothetical protein